MKVLYRKILIFSLFIVVIYAIIYLCFDRIYNYPSGTNSIFLWGDSQFNRGVIDSMIQESTGFQVYDASKDGSGVYDLTVFTEKVPENSIVIIGFNYSVFCRRKETDDNRSSFYLYGLYQLYKNNYSLISISKIINNNLKMRKVFKIKKKPATFSDSINITKMIKIFEEKFRIKPAYLYDKMNIYASNIEKLKRKKCSIFLIKLPFHPLAKKIIEESTSYFDLKKFENLMRRDSGINFIDLSNFQSRRNIIYDVGHLNRYGAELVTDSICSILKSL